MITEIEADPARAELKCSLCQKNQMAHQRSFRQQRALNVRLKTIVIMFFDMYILSVLSSFGNVSFMCRFKCS